MDNKDLDVEVLENQISFDLDSLGLSEKEESVSLTETLIKPQNHEWIKDEVLFVVVKTEKYNMNLCGKMMLEWVKLAGSNCEQMIIDDCPDIVERVRSINTEKKIIAVFYSDTPLLDKSQFVRIVEYFAAKSINFLFLNRGFIVKNDFLNYNPNIAQSTLSDDEKTNLLICDNSQAISFASEQLYNRIRDYHIKNGVVIYGKNTVFIDADVEIDGGVIIYPNNILQGESIISSGTILESGNIIKNSIISNNCRLCGSYIEDSKIMDNVNLDYGNKVIKEVR